MIYVSKQYYNTLMINILLYYIYYYITQSHHGKT